MKYLLSIKETSEGFIEVEACSSEEATDKAADVYFAGNVVFGNSSVEYGEPMLIEEE